jgi:hypothetical protein
VRSGDGGFCPSTQRHYRRIILLLILPHVSVVRPCSGGNIVNYIVKTILILGVCILLRVKSGDGGFYIRLHNITIVG